MNSVPMYISPIKHESLHALALACHPWHIGSASCNFVWPRS